MALDMLEGRSLIATKGATLMTCSYIARLMCKYRYEACTNTHIVSLFLGRKAVRLDDIIPLRNVGDKGKIK